MLFRSIKEWAETIRNVDFDEFDGDEECSECGGTGMVENPDDEEAEIDCEECDGTGEADVEEEKDTWLGEQRDKLVEAIGECPV